MPDLHPHPHAAAARIARREAAAALGIDPAFIDRLVERFYARVRGDVLLGPVFAARIVDWGPHLAQMKRFWGSILLGDGAFRGSPMARHLAIPGIEAGHFRRWLALFRATLCELEGDPAATAHVAARAEAIADSLLMGIRIHRDGRSDPHAMKGVSHA
jgi:hemoglobin